MGRTPGWLLWHRKEAGKESQRGSADDRSSILTKVFAQGEQYYDGASKQYQNVSASATAGLSTLVKHTRNLSVTAPDASSSSAAPNDSQASSPKTPAAMQDPDAHPDRPDSLPADIVKEAEGMLSRFRAEAAKRLKDIEKAEDAADEALLKFGTNIRSFLRDAVTIAPPTEDKDGNPGAVLFESKDSSGKKVVHATRFDAQLHVIHSSLDSFLKDPVSPEWENWKKGFNVEKKTDAIAKDLEKHAELRSAMEKCVPEKVEYSLFWERYYFLRHVIESEEQRRREMLKGMSPPLPISRSLNAYNPQHQPLPLLTKKSLGTRIPTPILHQTKHPHQPPTLQNPPPTSPPPRKLSNPPQMKA